MVLVRKETSGKLVEHSFEGLLPSYLMLQGFVFTHSIVWLELTKEVDFPNSLVLLLNVRCKRNNLWKILHGQAKICDYSGIKFQSFSFQLHYTIKGLTTNEKATRK